MNINTLQKIDEALTISGLRRNTINRVRNKSRNVRLKMLKETRNKDKNGRYRQFVFEVNSSSMINEDYVTRVRIYETIPYKSNKAETWVDCTCNDFRYRWDYALNKKGSSGRLHAKKKAPKITNPDELAGTCKHVYAAMQWLKNKKGL